MSTKAGTPKSKTLHAMVERLPDVSGTIIRTPAGIQVFGTSEFDTAWTLHAVSLVTGEPIRLLDALDLL